MKMKILQAGNNLNDDEDNFFDLLSRFQSKRMDDQRCSLTIQSSLNKESEKNGPKQLDVANGKYVLKILNFPI